MGYENPTQPLSLFPSLLLPLLLLLLISLSSFLPPLSLAPSSSYLLLLITCLLCVFIDTPSLSVTLSLLLFLITITFHVFKPSKLVSIILTSIQFFLLLLSTSSVLLNFTSLTIHLPSIFSSIEWGLYKSIHSLSPDSRYES